MDLIKGVALIISGETTRYGLSKEEKERGKKGVGGRGGREITKDMSLFTVATCP